MFECVTIDEFCLKWEKLMNEIGLYSKIERGLLSQSDVDFISNSVNIERLNNHPVKLDFKDIVSIIQMSILNEPLTS